MFVVTKLDRLARSLPDAGDTLELTKRSVKLSLGGLIRDPTGPVGRLLFTVWVCQPTGNLQWICLVNINTGLSSRRIMDPGVTETPSSTTPAPSGT